jgi:hypothetical protein
MTYPGQGWSGQQPSDNQPTPPSGWPQQQYPQQPYAGQPPVQGGPVQYPVGPPFHGQAPIPPVPPKRRRSGLTVGIIVAVVVLAAGGVGTWFAFDHAGSTGSASPGEAAAKLLADVGNDDLIGMVDDLPPAEASLFSDTITQGTDQFKRLGIVKPDVDPKAMTSLGIHTSGITFDTAAAERVNDHLTITKLIAGRITVSGTMSANDLTDSFLHSAFPDGVPSADQEQHTVDIAKEVREQGHPIRIATVQVDGKWYPSLFYSIADAGLQAAHTPWPTQSVPSVGAGSADDAVRQFLQAALNSDAKGVIERTSPDEMAALHDVGKVLIDSAGASPSSGVKIDSMTFADREVAGGVDTVLRGLTVTSDGTQITMIQSNGCYVMRAQGETQRFCASDLTKELRGNPEISGVLQPALLKLVQDMFSGLMNTGVGLVASEVGGQWYVSPGRTISQLAVDVYGTISPQDFAAVVQLAQPH